MNEVFLGGKVILHSGDCRDVLKGLADNSVDSGVMDPPYALVSIGKRFSAPDAAPAGYGTDGAYARTSRGFMGKDWDTGETAFAYEFWAEVLRVLKPGAHMVAFSGTRTYHRMAVAIEDAGFEIRDQLGWLYGSGFPKSQDVALFIDKSKGIVRVPSAVIEQRVGFDAEAEGGGGWSAGEIRISEPVSDEAKQWDGWGTAVKPAWEPIVLARKPLSEKTVAANVLRWGTGALNIDGCRIHADDAGAKVYTSQRTAPGQTQNDTGERKNAERTFTGITKPGRFPANIIHDGSPEVLAAFPANAGAFAPVRGTEPSNAVTNVYSERERVATVHHGDMGSAARFFYQTQPDDLLVWQAKAILRTWNPELANTADDTLSLSKEAVVSVLSDAVIWASRGTLNLCPERFTAATPRELRLISEAATTAILSIGNVSSLGSPLARLSLSPARVSVVVAPEPIGTTTITISHWKSDGSAASVIFSITPSRLELGVPASSSNRRFHYSAKADGDDRLGSKHPTVKPVDLMQWLTRLVTPPQGVVLDAFAGTGTTGEAAWREGFTALLIEREPEYQNDIRKRMALALGGSAARKRAHKKKPEPPKVGGMFGDD